MIQDGGQGQGCPLYLCMVDIHLYSGNSKEPVEVFCNHCHKIIGSKACIVIMPSIDVVFWYCIDCVSIVDFSHGEFLCGM